MSSNQNETGADEIALGVAFGTGVMKWGYLMLSLPGALLNAFVICLSLAPGIIEGDFKWFILSLACVDLTASLVYFGQSLGYFFLQAYPRFLCSAQAFLMFYGVFSCFWALLPVSIHRFINMFYSQYAEFFTLRKIFFLCLLVDTLPAMQIAPYGIWFGEWGQSSVTGTCTLLLRDESRELYTTVYSFNHMLIWLIFGLTLALNVGIFWKVRKHLSLVMTMDDKRRLDETRDLVTATMLQVLSPAVFQLPVTLVDAYSENMYDDAVERLVFKLYYLTPMVVMLVLNPIADALLSLYLLKPYRRATQTFLASLRDGKLSLKHENKTTTAAKKLVIVNPAPPIAEPNPEP